MAKKSGRSEECPDVKTELRMIKALIEEAEEFFKTSDADTGVQRLCEGPYETKGIAAAFETGAALRGGLSSDSVSGVKTAPTTPVVTACGDG